MSIRVALHHSTRYRYDRPVVLSAHVVRLRPAPHCRTAIHAYSLRIGPRKHFLNWQQDPFGNYEARLVFPEPSAELTVEVDLVAEMTTINPFDFFLEQSAEKFPFSYGEGLRRDLAPYLARTPARAAMVDFVERVRGECARGGRRTIDVLVDINRCVHDRLRYDIRMEPGVLGPDETLERGHGSCRDFAWLLVQVFRSLGLAARFVSGYSIQLVADQKPIAGAVGVERDTTDLHAWTEVFLPGAGWVGFDATSALAAGEGHIPLACTPDPTAAAPISGSFTWEPRQEGDPIGEQFDFAMSIRRISESPRETLPYSQEDWEAIHRLGEQVDDSLLASDVRLTMGGEPTFVAAEDPDAEEWNTAALGPTKRRFASELMERLRARFAPGGLIHEGQGKWYPGEPLPRWAVGCYFRKDGLPIWNDPTLFAPDAEGHDTIEVAHALVCALAERLRVDPGCVIPAYEDAWYYLWRERRLPENVDPIDAKLDDELERRRLSRIFDEGLGSVVGYALPLCRSPEGGWRSGPWFLRRERMFLIPGDSPMGYRLPLDSLTWTAKENRGLPFERDPFDVVPNLPMREQLVAYRMSPPKSPRVLQNRHTTGTDASPDGTRSSPHESPDRDAANRPDPNEVDTDVVRTALCVEPRAGVLHVFMPPLALLEEYLDLCAAIEDTASAHGRRVRIEGYPPPSDGRLTKFSATPDPGVLEINVQPVSSWKSLVVNTTELYEMARQSGLRGEKFMLDGRQSGTGGGNHIVLGGPTPADSPILRRPDLLRSLIAYWINHPSLTYLFSGLFVGPTSQAPRVDEARHDSVDELQIAFQCIDDLGVGQVPPWLTDRFLRHLLVDVTGNTHRTEFCIDKLYNPDFSSGRQGLVELRSFEMPPHPKMSLTEQLLVRALVSWFWHTPYRAPPVRWGTDLHDRFALPHFIWADFGDVVGDLKRAGFEFQTSWFLPHFEFRFPLLGKADTHPGIVIELRQAVEPWLVLGEEQGAGGTTRFVDSSVERVQTLVRGAVCDRHVLGCNGVRVPLRPTGTNGEFVAGVRYRAWQPPSALHPTIAPHTPLVFDLFDLWNGRAVAGCTYHVAHPGGLAHERFPMNALEAESRRAVRFWPFGHTPGERPLTAPPPNPRFPLTLDLRRCPKA